MKWFKESPLSATRDKSKEVWVRKNSEEMEAFPVDLYLGKKTDLLKLKKNIVENIKNKVEYYNKSRKELYSGENEAVESCPITGIATDQAEEIADIYGAKYVQTPDTGHVYVKNRPSKKTINDFYLNNVTYAATYTDKSSAESRLNSIAVPWVNWTIEVFEKQYGRKPKSILDVGSGAGHFVEACRRQGIQAEGIELSESSRDFAKEIWGFEMDSRDFIEAAADYEGFDIVTFWGLLEHTPNPGRILDAAYQVVSKSDAGMVISKLPRWDSLSSAIQRLNPETIIRHIDPMGHIMLFTDASAAELYYLHKFKPIAAWYYGMDVYETLMQIGNSTGDYGALVNTGGLQVELQQFIDEARFSDGLTLVGVPFDN
ncbi:class I SAM-dependent methyltransferase [Poritiphilus flavus]|uniref:Methyltransferase domain-containing protein n=1 Tax=Poritiphilus flavus TaxID=2697053 RepID=A0A6L9E8D4_9FLAO|nr:class I SAM-dependent methyltransferase [Poritiphilus flavus]NAS10976.1 methyltransferase domain-containing protein [Poritiphilus flavus]